MKKISLIILILHCVLVSCSKISNGEKYYKKGDLKKAEEYFLKELEESKKNTTMYNLGKLYEDQNKYTLAEKYYKLAVNNKKKDARDALNELYRKHENAFTCIPLNDDSLEVRDIKTAGGNQRYAVGEYDSAEKCYKMAIEEDNNEEAMRMLGIIYYENEKYDLAEQYYKMSIANGGTDVLYYLGELYFTTEKYDLAEKYYKQSLNNPNLGTSAMYDLGMLYFKEKEYSLSKEYLIMALENRLSAPELEETLEKLKKMGY